MAKLFKKTFFFLLGEVCADVLQCNTMNLQRPRIIVKNELPYSLVMTFSYNGVCTYSNIKQMSFPVHKHKLKIKIYIVHNICQ